ncbi:MAG: hypothetical protein KKC79_01375 [Gammaproteobacteria bacterium]|nr:hypothetical protein [Gammaproteobacteria bacterium]MBU1443661.1 hypothetical protein [Gammaproteobacteria bacterium]MBU2289103.1 hypothetical protein [Gammaproteobacteria bacterium]MBU2407280.1 hypothetical protein [Gammaproteobacteria bacterium]
MSVPPRQPPRFVPTLTTVLEPPDLSAPPAEPGPMPASAPLPQKDATDNPFQAITPEQQSQLNDASAFRLEEQLLHRVLQRVDLSLDQALSDTVAAAVQQQLDAMLPKLRSEIENVLRTLVSDALSRELSEEARSLPPVGGQSLG